MANDLDKVPPQQLAELLKLNPQSKLAVTEALNKAGISYGTPEHELLYKQWVEANPNMPLSR